MKRHVSLFLCVLLIMATFSVAYGEGEMKERATVSVDITLISRVQVIDSTLELELSDINGKVLCTAKEWVGGITKNVKVSFDVPEFKGGERFFLTLRGGLEYIKYYENVYKKNEPIELQTYTYLDENKKPCIASDFAFEGCPLYEYAVVVYAEKAPLEHCQGARIDGENIMVPLRTVSEALGIEVFYDEKYNSVVCSVGDKQIIFNIGTAYTTVFGQDIYMSALCEMIDGVTFVPISIFEDGFGCDIEILKFDDHLDLCIGESSVVKEYRESFVVNKWDISSQTEYMVWVDKSDYKVRVYKGSKNKWIEIKSFPCAIGAPNTPTITGSFEYQYKASAWYYEGYYVGPCLVFYGGYALHSTLLKFNDTPFDNRTGVMISHGCVRMEKPDIEWLAEILPLKSRIYVTE